MEPRLITALENFEAKYVERGVYLLYETTYGSGDTAILAMTEDGVERAFTLSVYFEDTAPFPGEFWVKDWSENEGIAEELERRGIIEFTGDTVRSGFVEARLANLTEEYR